MQDYKQEFNDREFLTFLKKFRGSMVFRGKSSFSYKLYDRINLIFKKSSLKKKVNPEAVFRYAISNLIPVVGISNIKRGRKVETVPVLLKLRKRIVLINKWLISSQKNKSNVRGIKVNDVARLILLAASLKGNAYDQKMDYTKKVYSSRHVLLKMGGRRNKRNFKRYQKTVLKELEAKYGVLKKKKPLETVAASIEKLFDTFIFLKYKRKYRRIKRVINDLRSTLLFRWNNTLDYRWVVLLEWIFVNSDPSKRIRFNDKKLFLLKKKYKMLWEQQRRKIE